MRGPKRDTLRRFAVSCLGVIEGLGVARSPTRLGENDTLWREGF